MVHTCAVCSNNSNNNKNVSFHKFPEDITKKTVWLKILNLNSVSKWSKICSIHFKPNDFIFSCSRNILQSTAVPISNYKLVEEHSYACRVLSSSPTSESSLNTAMTSVIYKSSPTTSSNEKVNIVETPLPSPFDVYTNMKVHNLPSTSSYEKANIETSQPSPFDLCTDVQELSPPKKRRRIWNSNRIGDLKEEDFSTPRRRTRNICLVKNTVTNIRRKNKILKQKNQRLKKKVSSLMDIINTLKEKKILNMLL